MISTNFWVRIHWTLQNFHVFIAKDVKKKKARLKKSETEVQFFLSQSTNTYPNPGIYSDTLNLSQKNRIQVEVSNYFLPSTNFGLSHYVFLNKKNNTLNKVFYAAVCREIIPHRSPKILSDSTDKLYENISDHGSVEDCDFDPQLNIRGVSLAYGMLLRMCPKNKMLEISSRAVLQKMLRRMPPIEFQETQLQA